MSTNEMEGLGLKEEARDYAGSKIGMWLFLSTEAFLFAALFLLYAAYRLRYARVFHEASSGLDLFTGTLNTAVLLTSSLTAALSLWSLKKGKRGSTLVFLLLTVLFGALFLANKYLEWREKIGHGLYPGSPDLLQQAPGDAVFWGLYFFTTGLHALHVAGGILLLAVMAFSVQRERVNKWDFIRLENSVLYWHMVDVIWIYIFPLFYLIG